MPRLPMFGLAALLVACAFAASCVAFGAKAADPTGAWDRDDGLGGIAIAPCGASLCGKVAWLSDKGSPAHIGQLVLFDMRQTAASTWSGSAFNPEDGETYAGSITVDGDHLSTRGCVLAGLICKSVGLSRPRR